MIYFPSVCVCLCGESGRGNVERRSIFAIVFCLLVLSLFYCTFYLVLVSETNIALHVQLYRTVNGVEAGACLRVYVDGWVYVNCTMDDLNDATTINAKWNEKNRNRKRETRDHCSMLKLNCTLWARACRHQSHKLQRLNFRIFVYLCLL